MMLPGLAVRKAWHVALERINVAHTHQPTSTNKHVLTGFVPTRGWRFGVAAVLVIAFVLCDQIVKVWVRAMAAAHAFPITVIPGVLDFDFVMNTGVAFGLAEGFGYSFVILAALVVVASFIYLLRAPLISHWEVVGLGMVCGGAIGNAIDRTVFGYVTDFIATTFINFPVFNIADIGITVGVVIALLGFLVFSPANQDAALRAKEDRERRLNSLNNKPRNPQDN